MKKDTHKTKVVFLMEQEIQINGETIEGDVMAYFPEECRIDSSREKLFTCYAHVGQHSEACEEYLKACKPATPEQYKDLAEELESIGYNLEIINP